MIYCDGKGKAYSDADRRIALCLARAAAMDADTPDGRYDIEDGLYVNVMTYSPRSAEGATFETHRKWADLQYILSGSEFMGVPDAANARDVEPYDEGRDIAISSAPLALLPMRERGWALFLPGEGHAPSISDGKCGSVKKAVFKLRI